MVTAKPGRFRPAVLPRSRGVPKEKGTGAMMEIDPFRYVLACAFLPRPNGRIERVLRKVFG